MIIKIRGQKIVQNFLQVTEPGSKQTKPLETYDWWLYDNIEKVRHGLREVNKEGKITQDADVIIPVQEGDFDPSDQSSERKKPVNFIWIVARTTYGKEITIATNSPSFLLNDTGQTIEKLSTFKY